MKIRKSPDTVLWGCYSDSLLVSMWQLGIRKDKVQSQLLLKLWKTSELSDLSLKVRYNFYPVGFPFLKRGLNSPFLFFIITTPSIVPPTLRNQKHCWVIVPYTPLNIFSILSIEMSILGKRRLSFWSAVLQYWKISYVRRPHSHIFEKSNWTGNGRAIFGI